MRNVASAGIPLERHVQSGLLRFETKRPTSFGFEMHLAHMQRELDRFRPSAVIIDPVTSFRGPDSEVHALLLRMMDILKTRGITAVFTSLTSSNERTTQSDLVFPPSWIPGFHWSTSKATANETVASMRSSHAA